MGERRWKVTRDYQAAVPGEGPGVAFSLTAGTVIDDADLEGLRDGDRIAEWVNRDSPGTLEETDEAATDAPTLHPPAYLLSGAARRGPP